MRGRGNAGSIKTRMGTILSDSSHSLLVNPKIFLSARLRLFKLAAPSGFSNHFLQPRAFLYCLLQHYVPAVHSTIPKKCFPERSSFFSHPYFNISCDLLKGEKLLPIRRSFRFQCDTKETKVSFLSPAFFWTNINLNVVTIICFVDEPLHYCFGSNFSFYRAQIRRSGWSGFRYN